MSTSKEEKNNAKQDSLYNLNSSNNNDNNNLINTNHSYWELNTSNTRNFEYKWEGEINIDNQGFTSSGSTRVVRKSLKLEEIKSSRLLLPTISMH
jgi:hypothetical protein